MPFWTEELHPSLQFIVTEVCPSCHGARGRVDPEQVASLPQ